MIQQDDSFSAKYIRFLSDLEIPSPLPDKTEVLYPYNEEEVQKTMSAFYGKYYGDNQSRTFLIGINPGRFGAGVTGIPFTDPINLEEYCGIRTSFKKTHELSSRYIYDLVESMKGAENFYSRFFLTAFSPLGFTWQGKNRNYYDTPALWKTLRPWIIRSFHEQLELGANRDIAFSLGQGKNYKILQELNREEKFFKEIRPLPHPRWVMQYRLKRKEEFLTLYREELMRAGGQS